MHLNLKLEFQALIEKQINMRKVLEFFQDVIKSCNVFTAPVNLRYNLDPDYNTVPGGIVSISLIILLVSIFYSACLEVLNKQAISSTTQIVREIEPEYMTVNTNEFMFAVGINGLNLSNTNQSQYFQIKMKKYIIVNSPTYNRYSQAFTLEPCTAQHWQQLGQDFVEIFERQKLSAFLCPPKNLTLQFEGKYTSEKFYYYRIQVARCESNCRTQAQIDAWFAANSTFSFNFYYSNTLINPDQTQPLSNFFQDKDYQVFSAGLQTSTNLYIGKYVMETDQSILPWTDIQIQEGFVVNRQEKQSWSFMSTSQSYCKFYIRKSNIKQQIQRSFRKIDDMLSYIGGLFGIIAVIFGFVMNYYSQCSFQLQMCQNTFDYHNKTNKKDKMNEMNSQDFSIDQNHNSPFNNHEQNQSKSKQKEQEVIEPKNFGFLDFLIHLVYSPLNKIFNFNWRRMKIYEESLQEMRYKLDVSQLMQKLSFYDRSINALFDENQLKLLYLQEKYNFEEVRQERELLGLRSGIIANLFGMVVDDILSKNEQSLEKKKTLKEIQSQRSRQKLKTFIGNHTNVLDVFGKIVEKNSQKQGSQVNLPEDIKKALKKLDDKIQKGDLVSVRIYNNLQYQILQAFEKSKLKKTKHCVAAKSFQAKRQKIDQVRKKQLTKKQKNLVVNFANQNSATSICNLALR